MLIGEKIKQRRNELKWSQRELARRMNYTDHSTIARIEKGQVDVSQTRIMQFAEVLGTTVQWLMNWEEVQKNNDVISDIVVRLRKDSTFLEAVSRLNELDEKKLSNLLELLK